MLCTFSSINFNTLNTITNMTPRERCVRVLLRILSSPYRFTLQDLASHFEQPTIEGIKEDIRQIRQAGIHVDIQKRDRFYYAILPETGFRELQYLQPLSELDKAKIVRALDYLGSERDRMYLERKLDSLYDFQRLGLRSLRRPALDRIDKLESARKQKKRTILVNYRSNSGTIRDRKVEPFDVDVELDTLQAYDLTEENPGNKHFLLSRIERVAMLEETWKCEEDHRYQKTDVFRISNNDQELVQLEMDLYAYNALVGSFPKALADITAGVGEGMYEFQSMVNADFIGLSNYILGNAGMAHIRIIRPVRLIEMIIAKTDEIKHKITC